MSPIKVDIMFRAFADQSRLRILHLLKKGEQCVCDIMDVLKLPQPKVSRHLNYLKRAGLVDARKDGLWVYYSLSRPKSEFQRRLLSCLECCLEDVPVLTLDLKRLKKKRKSVCF